MLPLIDGIALVVEDNPDTRDWLVSCVNAAFAGMQVLVADSVASGAQLISQHNVDLGLIDLGLPDGSGIDLIKALAVKDYPSYIVVATIYDDDKNLFAALKSGAKGYILKDQDRERIVSYLKGIKKNRPPLSAASSQRLIDHFNAKGSALDQSQLTARESEIICLIGKGYSVEETALMLHLSPDTIKGYIKGVYAKLGVSNRAELTLEAVRLGIIDSN